MKKNSCGFTTVELLVALTVSGLLATLSAPSFKRLLQSRAVESSVSHFMSDLRYARSEANRRGGTVVVCHSDAPELPQASCSTGTASKGAGWAGGWIVFHDLDHNGTRSADEEILRAQTTHASIDTIAASGQSTKVIFNALGRLENLNYATTLRFGGDSRFASAVQRVVCVSLSGRARIAGDGTASCVSTG